MIKTKEENVSLSLEVLQMLNSEEKKFPIQERAVILAYFMLYKNYLISEKLDFD